MQGFHAAAGRGTPGRRRVGALMGGRAQIHLGIMEDEVVEMDALASAKQASDRAGRRPGRPLSSLKDVSDKMIIFCLGLGTKKGVNFC